MEGGGLIEKLNDGLYYTITVHDKINQSPLNIKKEKKNITN